MNYKRPRTYPKTFARDFLRIIAKLKSKIRPFNNNDLTQIDLFVKFLKINYNYKFIDCKIWEEIMRHLIYYSELLPFLFDGYTKLLKKISPKIIFVGNATHGGHNVPLIMSAKELKIPVGDYQHGAFSLNHAEYNFSSKLPDFYNHYLPEFFMSYGDYWTKLSRIPIKILNIGNPYLSEYLSQIEINNNNNNNILFISSTHDPERCIQDIIQMKEYLKGKDYNITFRVHPSEENRLQTVYKPIIDAGITIDLQPLYESLRNFKYVIGYISTVLFEALAFNCIVFIIETTIGNEYFDMKEFNYASCSKEITSKIINKNYKKIKPDKFWSNNWRDNYRQIIDYYLDD